MLVAIPIYFQLLHLLFVVVPLIYGTLGMEIPPLPPTHNILMLQPVIM